MKINKKILILALLAVLVLPFAASAQVTITSLVANTVKITWTVATAIVVVLWLFTGILFLAAQGDPGKLKIAKTALFSSIAGTVIVIVAYSAMQIVGSAITSGT
jgi:hypothetical protein